MSQQGKNQKPSSKSQPPQIPPQSSPQGGRAGGTRAAERIKERERERQRRRIYTIGAVVVALVVIFAILFILVNVPQDAPIPEGSAARYADIQMLRSQEGFPLLGDLSTPVKVTLYTGFDCNACREFHDQIIDGLVQRVRDGKIALIFAPLYGTNDVANGQGAAVAAICSAEQRVFWQFQDMLYDWESKYGNQSFTNNRINAGVDALKLDRGQQSACVASSGVQDILNTAKTQAAALLNFHNMPTIAINGVVPLNSDQAPVTTPDEILAAIDQAVENLRAVESTPEAESTAEVTPAVMPEATEAMIGAAEATPQVEATAEATPEATTEAGS